MSDKSAPSKKLARTSIGGGAILHLSITDKAALYSVYMPFVRGGGLFVPTPRPFQIGDEVFVLVTLWDQPDPMPVLANVVWLTPVGAQGKRAAGIGVRFKPAESDALRTRIENLLAGQLKSERPTHTM